MLLRRSLVALQQNAVYIDFSFVKGRAVSRVSTVVSSFLLLVTLQGLYLPFMVEQGLHAVTCISSACCLTTTGVASALIAAVGDGRDKAAGATIRNAWPCSMCSLELSTQRFQAGRVADDALVFGVAGGVGGKQRMYNSLVLFVGEWCGFSMTQSCMLHRFVRVESKRPVCTHAIGMHKRCTSIRGTKGGDCLS